MPIAMVPLQAGVHGCASSPNLVAIHPVVVDEQVALQQLQSPAELRQPFHPLAGADTSVGGCSEGRTQAFAAAHRQCLDLIDELQCGTGDFPCFASLFFEEAHETFIHYRTYLPQPRRQPNVRSLRCDFVLSSPKPDR
jgi:hypothetical protein